MARVMLGAACVAPRRSFWNRRHYSQGLAMNAGSAGSRNPANAIAKNFGKRIEIPFYF